MTSSLLQPFVFRLTPDQAITKIDKDCITIENIEKKKEEKTNEYGLGSDGTLHLKDKEVHFLYRDMHYKTVMIENGCKLITGPFKVYVQDVFEVKDKLEDAVIGDSFPMRYKAPFMHRFILSEKDGKMEIVGKWKHLSKDEDRNNMCSDGEARFKRFTSLKRDMFYSSLAIEAPGAHIKFNGFRVFVEKYITH